MTVLVSRGGLVPARKGFPFPTSLPVSKGPSGGYIPLLRGEGLAHTYEGIYKSQPWVYAVVNKLAYGIARLPFKVYEELEGDSRQRARGNDLDRLLRSPGGRRSSFDLKLDIAGSLLIHGNALVLKSRESEGAPPNELWVVPWRLVETIEDERGIIGYSILIGAETYAIAPRDVVHYRFFKGISPIEPLRRTLALEDAAMTYQGNNFLNGITPRGAFVTDRDVNEKSAERLRAELSQMYAGVDNAGRFGVLGNGFKWEQMGQSAVDADLINQRRLSREEVCGAYDVSPVLVGILDRATFSNVEELHKSLYVDAIGPKLTLIEETTQTQLIDEEPAWDGYFVEFDTNEVLRPDPEARFRAYLMAQQSSTLTVNERRKLENLPPIDDPAADTVFMPVNMVAVGQGPSPAPADSNSTEVPALPDGASMAQELLTQAVKEAQTINISVPEKRVKSRRIERDTQGNIVRIVEEADEFVKANRVVRDENGNIAEIIEE